MNRLALDRGAAILFVVFLSTAAFAQSATSQPASAPTSRPAAAAPVEIDFTLETRLIDASRRLEDRHRNQISDAEEYVIGGASLELRFSDGRESVRTTTDSAGVLRVDVPKILTGTQITIDVTRGDDRFRSLPVTVTERAPDNVSVFSVIASSDNLVQACDYLFVWAPEAQDGLGPARLLAVVEVENGDHRFVEPDGSNVEIPLPDGATLVKMSIDGVEQPMDRVERTERGVALEIGFETGMSRESRVRRAQVECVLDVEDGARIEFPFTANLTTARVSLISAGGRFHYDEWTTRAKDRLSARGRDPQLSAMLGKEVTVHSRSGIARGARIPIAIDVGPEPPSRRVEARIAAVIFDATAHIDAFEGLTEGSPPPDILASALPGAEVTIELPAGSESREITATADVDGVLAASLGALRSQQVVQLRLERNGVQYRSPPIVVRSLIESPIGLYRLSSDPSGVVLQAVNWIVTDASTLETDERGLERVVPPPFDEEGRTRVRFRRIAVAQNVGSTAFVGAGGVIAEISAPAGAIGLTVQVDDETLVADESTGPTIPVEGPLFPIVASGAPLRLVSSYELDVAEGDAIDLSYESAFATGQLSVALGIERFHYDPGAVSDTVRLRVGERMGRQTGMNREVQVWNRANIAAGERIPIEFRYGTWQVAPRTVRFVLALGAVLALTVTAALLGRRASASRRRAELTKETVAGPR